MSEPNKSKARVRIGPTTVVFYCFACKELHAIPKDVYFIGNEERPSFLTSIVASRTSMGVNGNPHGRVKCHFYMFNGKLLYWYDCARTNM